MSFEEEFKTVDLLEESDAETRMVDAFSLSVIKAERQIRKIFTHLIYQNISFTGSTIKELKETLASNRKVYFKGFIQGFNKIYPKSVSDIYGENHDKHLSLLEEAIKYRNKIFHGQLTGKHLSRDKLNEIVKNIRTWCKTLSETMKCEIGYDGFERNSYRKSANSELLDLFTVKINTIEELSDFINQNMVKI